MRHLVSRFIRDCKGLSHVTDPYLDLRPIFKDLVVLEHNLRRRNLNNNVFSIATDYAKWWSCFRMYSELGTQEENADLRRKTRSLLLDHSNGLIEALKLPNGIDNEIFECAALPATTDLIQFDRIDKPSLLIILRRCLEKLMLNAYDATAIRYSPPHIVRPALIEACNFDVNDFPLISDGEQNFGRCLVGIGLPSMASCFVHKRLGVTNHWPITLFSTGEQYRYHTDNSQYLQRSVFCLLNLYKNENERIKWQNSTLNFLQQFFCSLPLGKANIKFENVSTPNLQLVESSAAVWKTIPNGNTTETTLARFSRLNDYMSYRMNITVNKRSHGKFIKNLPNIAGFMSSLPARKGVTSESSFSLTAIFDSAFRQLRYIRRQPITLQIGVGAVSGCITGFTFSKISRLAAIVAGCSIVILQFFNYRGYLKFNRTQLQRDFDDLKNTFRTEIGMEKPIIPTAKESESMFTIHFTVDVESPYRVYPNESVFAVGSHEKLGCWDPKQALRLTKNNDGKFSGTIDLVNANVIKFRYFIGFYLESELNKPPSLIISKWETHLTPRSVIPAVEASKTRVCRSNVNDIFGFCSGKSVVSDGWISNEDENQILLTVTGTALKFYKSRHVEENYCIKVVPLDLRNKHDSPACDDLDGCDDAADETLPNLPSYSRTEIAELHSDNPHFRDQHECGESFQNSVDYLVFRTLSVAVEYLGFRIEVYSPIKNSLIAVGYAVPSTLHDTYGNTSVPLITTKGIPVGKIYFRYLFIRALSNMAHQQLMNVSYSRHWKKRTTLEVGHRGMGNSYTKCAVARENTLHSLNGAAKNGADLVEFDVHLSKDKVVIVYHDFHVMVSVAKRSPSIAEDLNKISSSDAKKNEASNGGNIINRGIGGVDFYQLAVKDLKLNQLKLLHLDHVAHQDERSENYIHRVTGEHDEAEEHRPFPTLVEAFKNVEEDVGFNIEIKYPMIQINGENECENYFERNEFLDIILKDVLAAAGNRRIVFSSFDPDICTMISLKQNKYPVLFLCVGDTIKHVPYIDERTRTSMTAVKFVAGMGLLGVNFNSEDVLRDPTPILKAREYRLISFVWGDELVDKKNVDYFKKTLLVDGVIYDRIGEGEQRSSVFSLEKKMKAALFSSKKLPSPVTPPRSSSISHLSENNTNNGYCEASNKRAQPVENQMTAQKPKEWPQHKPQPFYNSFGHRTNKEVYSHDSPAAEFKFLSKDFGIAATASEI